MRNIYVNLLTGNSSRITKSNGCIEADNIDGVKCLKETYIPVEPWLPISLEESKDIIVGKKNNYNDLTLLKLPKKISSAFKSLNISNCINIHDINYLQNSKDYKVIMGDLLSFLRKHCLDQTELIPHNIYFGKPNLKNNTFNSKDKVYIGMHLDSWEGDPFEARSKSKNRICINLGKESRFLLFYNIGLDVMAEIANFNTTEFSFEINNIYKVFAKKNLNWPIYRLEIKPYEAYVAPTEYIIHDGSSWHSSYPDINLVVRGHFYFNQQTALTRIKKYFNL